MLIPDPKDSILKAKPSLLRLLELETLEAVISALTVYSSNEACGALELDSTRAIISPTLKSTWFANVTSETTSPTDTESGPRSKVVVEFVRLSEGTLKKSPDHVCLSSADLDILSSKG